MLPRTVRAGRDIGGRLVADHEIATYQIILVDDGSTDQTPALVDELAAAPDVTAVHHRQNRGLGASIRSGFDAATGDVILYTDTDLPFDLLELHKALRLLRIYEADVVSMYRFDRMGEGAKRLVLSHLYNGLIRAVLGVRLRDVNFAGKLMRGDVPGRLDLRSDGSFIDAELLAKAERLGLTIVQFGVDYFPRTRGTSTLSSPAVILGILSDLLRWRKELRHMEVSP